MPWRRRNPDANPAPSSGCRSLPECCWHSSPSAPRTPSCPSKAHPASIPAWRALPCVADRSVSSRSRLPSNTAPDRSDRVPSPSDRTLSPYQTASSADKDTQSPSRCSRSSDRAAAPPCTDQSPARPSCCCPERPRPECIAVRMPSPGTDAHSKEWGRATQLVEND